MTIKTVCSYSCAICCSIIIIFAIATNYWIEYKAQNPTDATGISLFNVGLFQKCEIYQPKEVEDEDDVDRGCEDYFPDMEGYGTARMVLIGTFIIALLLTLISFIFVTVYCSTGKYYFPVGRVAICNVASAICIAVGLVWFTMVFKNEENSAFSWSYGAGWSAFGMYIITTVLLYADK